MRRMLVIEDDPAIRTSLLKALTDRGYTMLSSANGMDGLQTAIREQVDLVILDLGLPDISGLEFLRMFRAVSETPVVVVTAQDEKTSLVQALNLGADDYVTKPFSADHLDARIKAVLRRSVETELPTLLRLGDLEIDLAGRQVRLAGADILLTPKEFDLLAYLAARPGQVIAKRELSAEIWQANYGGADRTVDVHVSWLRRKLGESANNPVYVHTVRGVGVKLSDPTAKAPS